MFSVSRAARALKFINNLTHTKGASAGQTFNLRRWQKQPLAQTFGVLNPDGTRQYRTLWIEIPRKNGKSELCAALALYMLCGDGEMGAEVYGAASDQDQANLVFDVAAQMVRNDAELSAKLDVRDAAKRIIHKATGSFYRAIPADAGGSHGFNGSCVIVDELHVWLTPKARKLYEALTTSTGARRQPLVIVITTAGYDRTSICWEMHQYAIGVRDGMIEDPSFLPVIYAAPDDADWTDEKVWAAANPALGDFRGIDEMRTFARKAKAVPSQQNTFRQLYLNQWVEQATRWLDMFAWRKCKGNVSEPDLAGLPCFGGLDLGQSDDLSAFVRLWCHPDGRKFVRANFWIPQAAIERFKTRPYDAWRRSGWLTVTQGDITDFDQVEAEVAKLCHESGVRQLAYDKKFASQLALHLQGQGIKMVDTPQGFQLNEALNNLSDLVVEGKLVHDGNPILDFHASNAVVRTGQKGEIRLAKESTKEKIDGISALAMANARAITLPPTSAYERGVMILG